MLCIAAAVTKAITGMSEQVNATVAQVSFSRKGTISIAHCYHGPGWCMYWKLYVFLWLSHFPHILLFTLESRSRCQRHCV